MPTYEYRCPEGHDFERFFRSIGAAEPNVACPVCGKIAERRMSAGAGLLFKGSGFYLTDYGKNAHRTSGSAPQKTEGGASGGSDSSPSTPAASDSKPPSGESKPGSADSKPAAKAEAKPAATTPSKPKSDK